MHDFDEDLRSASEVYPSPNSAATARARLAVLRAAALAAPRRTAGRGQGVGRTALVAATIAVTAAAFAAGYAVASGRAPGTQTASTAVSAPGFLPAIGWSMMQNGIAVPTQPPTASASTVPFAVADSAPGSPPVATVASLKRDSVLIWAQFGPSGQNAQSDKTFPARRLPLQLRHSTEAAPEGFAVPGAVRNISARVDGLDVFILVFFGADKPSAAATAAANEELARLSLPACPSAGLPIYNRDLPRAASYLLMWLRAHYPGPPRDLARASATALRVSHGRGSRIDVVNGMCGRAAPRNVAVEVRPHSRAAGNMGVMPLLYFLVKTPKGWLVWRQG